MIETLLIGGSIGLTISGVMLAVSRNAWRKHALKLQQVISDYEDELQDEKRLKRAFEQECKGLADKNAALIGDRDVLQKLLGISEKTISTLQHDVAELRASEQARQAAQKEAQDDRFSEVAKRSKCEAELVSLRAKHQSTEAALERSKNAQAYLVRECEKMDAQIKGIKAALAQQPEPTE